MAGRSFIDATIGSADDIQRSRLLLQASLGDARKVESAFDAAIDLAREIGPLTRQEALQSMRFMVPLAGGNVGEAAELTRMAKALQVTNPEQDFGGALFSLRELIGSGQVRSLRERFNISGLPTRTEAEALARDRGQTTAQVYMTEFRAKLQELYGQGGQDAVTALLDADTSTVRGQVTMLATIFQDALADIGSDPQGRLNERLEDTIDRARAYVESKDFQDLSSRISEGMVGGVDRFLDFLESNPIERAEAFMDKWGGVILTIAKIYGLNVLTGGAITSLGGALVRRAGGRTAAQSAAQVAASGAGGAALSRGFTARGPRFFGQMGRGARVGGAVSKLAGLGLPGILAGLAIAAVGLTHHLVNNSEAAEEAADAVKRARDRFNDVSLRVEPKPRLPGGPKPVTHLSEAAALIREDLRKLIEGDLQGQRHSGLNVPTAFASQGEIPLYGTNRVFTAAGASRIRGNLQGAFGSTFGSDEQDLFNQYNELFQMWGVSMTGFEVGGSPSDIRFVGGVEGMSGDQRRNVEGARGYLALSEEEQSEFRSRIGSNFGMANSMFIKAEELIHNSQNVADALNAAAAAQPVAVVEEGAILINVIGDLSAEAVDTLSVALTPRLAEVYADLVAGSAND
jgi:hypothetical protein